MAKHDSSGQKKHGGKDKSQDKSQDKKDKGGKEKRIKNALFDPRATLSGKDLKKAIKAMVGMEWNPQIASAQRTTGSLRDVLGEQVGQQKRLGQQAVGNIGSYYKSLADAEANNVALQRTMANKLGADVTQSGNQSAQALQNASNQAFNRMDTDYANRGGGMTSARDELINLVAGQQSRQTREQAALQAQAEGQGTGFAELQRALASATQLRGATQRSDTARSSIDAIRDLQLEYGPDIRESLGSINDLKKQKAAAKTAKLMELRGSERDYMLSKGALGIDKAQLASDASSQASQLKLAKQYGKNAQRAAKAQRKNIRVQGKQSRKGERTHGSQSRKTIGFQGQQYGGGGGGKSKPGDSGDRDRAKSAVASSGFSKKELSNSKNRKRLVNLMFQRYSIPNSVANWAIHQYMSKGKTKSFKGARFGRGNRATHQRPFKPPH